MQASLMSVSYTHLDVYKRQVNKEPIVSEYDTSIMQLLLLIKGDIDKKVYDKSDVLKKDAYFCLLYTSRCV